MFKKTLILATGLLTLSLTVHTLAHDAGPFIDPNGRSEAEAGPFIDPNG